MKKLYIMIFILLLWLPGIYADPYKLSPDFRPVKITIYWAGWDEEREHTYYEYNNKGLLKKSLIYRGKDTPSWYSTYEYDEDNKLIKKSTYSSSELSSYITFTYINKKLYREAEYDKDGNNKSDILYEYDDNGNMITISTKKVPYDNKFLSWNSIQIFTYGSDQKISQELFYYEGTLSSRTLYEYKKDSFIKTSFGYGDLRDVSYKTITTYQYSEKGKNKGKLKELVNNSLNLHEGKEYVECCTTYSMKPEFGPAGNMTSLTFYNCENKISGTAVIIWEKGKTDMALIKKIFERIHWFFTGC